MKVRFATDQWVTVGPPQRGGGEFEHTITAGTVVDVERMYDADGRTWAVIRVPGFEHVDSDFPIQPDVCVLVE